jgi:glucose-1-phosphate thymidylyltransferase
VAEFRGRHLSAINEKPRHTTSQYAVAGLYLYDSQVFDIIRALKPSPRREFEISDVNNAYLALGQLRHRILRGWWCDAGASPQALLAAGLQVARERGHRV